MRIEFEIVKPDEGSSFRLLHQKTLSTAYQWQYHYHPEVEITCVRNGRGSRHVGNHWGMYHHGELALIGSNLPHSGFGLNASDPHEEIVVQVKEEMILSGAKRPEMTAISQLFERAKYGLVFLGKTKKIITQKLIDLTDCSSFERLLRLMNIFQELALSDEYLQLNNEFTSFTILDKRKQRLQKIFTYVEQNFDKEILIEDAARLVGLSIPSFCNFFKTSTKSTFTDFVNHFRIQKACLLLHEDKTIAETSFATGFNNVTYFNKVFKNIVNKTPSEFRNTM